MRPGAPSNGVCPVCTERFVPREPRTAVSMAGKVLFWVHSESCADRLAISTRRFGSLALASARQLLAERFPRASTFLEGAAFLGRYRRDRRLDGQQRR